MRIGGRFQFLVSSSGFSIVILSGRDYEKKGHTVVVAESGKKPLDVWRKQPFDLILMDVQMPEMDGFEAMAIIRAEEKSGTKHVPIRAMTAHAMVGDRERCLAAVWTITIPNPSVQPICSPPSNALSPPPHRPTRSNRSNADVSPAVEAASRCITWMRRKQIQVFS